MFELVKFTLRAKLALMYGALIALTMMAFAVIAYITVSNELMMLRFLEQVVHC
jgi:hypothetical protein